MQTPVLLRFFDRSFIIRLFCALLTLSVPMLGDGYLLIHAAERYGVFYTLGVAAATGLAGMIITLGAIDATLEKLRHRVREGEYPGAEYADMGALVFSGILVIIPGFVTDGLAILLYLPPLRRLLGSAIVRRLKPRLREVYEYLKLLEFG